MRFSYRIEDGGHDGKESSRTFKIMPANEPAQMKGQAIFTPARFRPDWLFLSKKRVKPGVVSRHRRLP